MLKFTAWEDDARIRTRYSHSNWFINQWEVNGGIGHSGKRLVDPFRPGGPGRAMRALCGAKKPVFQQWLTKRGAMSPRIAAVAVDDHARAGFRLFVYKGLDFPAENRQNVYVRVISLKLLRDFWTQHADAEAPLRAWYKTVRGAEWKSLKEARASYPHADGVVTETGETLTIFNVGGNKYRLIARIRYDYQLVNIRFVLTHAEYDKGQWKE